MAVDLIPIDKMLTRCKQATCMLYVCLYLDILTQYLHLPGF